VTRPTPMIDDIALDAVTSARHRSRLRVAPIPVAGLQGDVQQQLGRASHEIELAGLLVGEAARDALEKLQKKAATGEELVFHSDVTTALEVEKVVLRAAEFEEVAGRPSCYAYRLELVESPPLPPPAELSPFGGLDGLDVGFDPGALGDVLDQVSEVAGQIQEAVEAVQEAVATLEALASLGDLALGNPFEPMQRKSTELESVGGAGADAAGSLSRVLGGGS